MADYSSIDAVINAWVERHGFSLYTRYAGGPECRNVYVSRNEECCQIWIDPPESGEVVLQAADVETRNDEEMRQDWRVPVHDLEHALEEALAFVQQWMKRHDESKQRSPFPKLFFIGLVVAGIAALSGLGYMLTTAIEMVRSGRGLETYRTSWLVEFNWLSFLVLVAGIVLALLIAGVMHFREFLLWHSLVKKYSDTDKD